MNSFRPAKPSRLRPGFTLVELLTVIAIVGILATIIIPVVGKVRSTARRTACISNLRQIGTAVNLYAQDNRGILVPQRDDARNLHWSDLLAVYAQKEVTAISDNFFKGVSEIFKCPAHADDPGRVASRYYVFGYGMNTQVLLPERANHNWTNDLGGKILLHNVTLPSRRPLLSESNDVNLFPANRSFVRHGNDRANVLFVGGNIGTLNAAGLEAAINDPSASVQ